MSTAHKFDHAERSARSSGTATPTQSSSSYVPAGISHAVTGFLRRLSHDQSDEPGGRSFSRSQSIPNGGRKSDNMNGAYTPPRRNLSPFQPPPLYPLTLKGYSESTSDSGQLLSTAIAEEIRLLVPDRLQVCEEWNLVYNLEQDGVSLATLYQKCEDLRGLRNGFVLVVKDAEDAVFGAYLTEAPHPAAHFFGTGECFLWRASILSSAPDFLRSLPPPPSADTTNMQRSTTLSAARTPKTSSTLAPPTPTYPQASKSAPELRIRFKAFPYSGVNDYLMFCQQSFLSVGGGDGHYGLWLDDGLEKGISSSCPTFGNEPLSEEGEKFDIIGVEIWSIGNN